MLKAVIFDFDGVLCDTFDFHLRKIKEFTGLDISEECYRDIHDGNFYQNKNNGLVGVDWPAYIKYIYPEQSNLKIKDNICEVLGALSKKYELFVLSSGGVKNISDCLLNNGIFKLFTGVFGVENNKLKIDNFKLIFDKYELDSSECVFITDTLGDLKEANHVGVKSIAVDFGFHDRECLLKGDPYKIISNFDDILSLIDEKLILIK